MKNGNHQGYEYDAVIIGSGIGGLVTAAYLARSGVRVLVCEQHKQPGGYFTSFKRKGYTFDGGIQACEDSGILFSCLEQLGVRDRIELHRSTFAYATPDVFLPLHTPADIARFYAELSKAFPAESQGISFISKKVYEFSSTTEAFTSLPNPLFVPFTRFLGALPGWIIKNWNELKSGPELMRHMSITMEDFFRQHLRDPDLLRFLGQLGYEGTPAAFVLGMVTFVLDYYYPKGGIQAISDVLAEFIQEKGGTIRYKTLVEEKLEAMKAQIRADIAVIFRAAEPTQLQETSLATLKRQIRAKFDERFGRSADGEEFVQEVLIAKCTQFRADI